MKRFLLSLIIFAVLLPSAGYSGVAMVGASASLLPEMMTQNRRVITDSGSVISQRWPDRTLRTLKAQGVYSSTKFLGDANFAVKKDGAGAVSTLYDISGNNNDAAQATGGNQPIWTAAQQNGKAALALNTRVLVAPLSSIAQPNTLIVVVKQTGDTSKVRMVIDGNAGRNAINATGATGNWSLYGGGNVFSTTASNLISIFTGIFNGASSTLFRNGASIATGNAGSNAMEGMYLGDYAGGGNEMIGNIHLACVINATLTTAQRQAIEGVANDYYAIY